MGSLLTICEWKTPVSVIPAQTVGKFHVKKRIVPRGTVLSVGASGVDEVVFVAPVEVTVLREGVLEANDTGSVWMSDTPMEFFSTCDLVNRAIGPNVLVGGLGLGLVCHLLMRRRDIKKVVVVELMPEVVQMTKPYLPDGVEVIRGDFLRELNRLARDGHEFQTVIADLWKSQESGREMFEDAQMSMDDWYPDAVHLFWAFQEEVDDKIAQYAMIGLKKDGVLNVKPSWEK